MPTHPFNLSRIRFSLLHTALLLTIGALAGCQHLHYQPPTTVPTADITFSSSANIAVQPMVCVPGKGFRDTEYAIARKPFDSAAFDEINLQLKKKPEVTVKVVADTSTVIAFRMQQKDRSKIVNRCTVAMRFTPEAQALYQAKFHLAGEHCGMELVDSQGLPVTEAVAVPAKCN